MEKVEVYLGLGSNLGDREANLSHGLKELARRLPLTQVSSIYVTEPWGYEKQPLFLNCVCHGSTFLPPGRLLELLKETEVALGRKPTFLWGPRAFDADLLFYGQRIIDEPALQVPHPRLTERAFVLVPLVEIAPHLRHPVLELTARELRDMVSGRDGVRYWAPPPRVGASREI